MSTPTPQPEEGESPVTDYNRALRDYIAYLMECDKLSSGLLYAHNWKWPEELLARGAKLREKITRLEKVLPAYERELAASHAHCAKLREALQLSHDAWHAMLQHEPYGRKAAGMALDEGELTRIEEALAATPASACDELAALRADKERLMQMLRSRIRWSTNGHCYEWVISGPHGDTKISLESAIELNRQNDAARNAPAP